MPGFSCLLGGGPFPGFAMKRDKQVAEIKRRLKKAEQERRLLRDAAFSFAKESKRDTDVSLGP